MPIHDVIRHNNANNEDVAVDYKLEQSVSVSEDFDAQGDEYNNVYE